MSQSAQRYRRKQYTRAQLRQQDISTVTDTFTGQSVTVDSRELAATIAAWFPAAPADVTDTLIWRRQLEIDNLTRALQ